MLRANLKALPNQVGQHTVLCTSVAADSPSALSVVGAGPFHLPACGDEVQIYADEEVAMVTFKTVYGQQIGVPIPRFALPNLGLALISEAQSR